MIIFGGWGILTPLFGVLGLLAMATAGTEISHGNVAGAWLFGGLIASGLCWEVGIRLNKRKGGNHLFFVPMQYYAILYALFFGAIAFHAQYGTAQAQSPTPTSTAGKSDDQSVPTAEELLARIRSGIIWRSANIKDGITDTVTPAIKAEVQFDDGLLVQLQSSCSVEGAGGSYKGIWINFDAFKSGQPAPFIWTQSNSGAMTALRVRLDDADVTIGQSAQNFTNEVQAVFYEPTSKPLLADLAFFNVAGGTLDQLLTSNRLRVELVLADGTRDVVDIATKEPTFKAFVQKCSDSFIGERKAAKAEAGREERCERARSTTRTCGADGIARNQDQWKEREEDCNDQLPSECRANAGASSEPPEPTIRFESLRRATIIADGPMWPWADGQYASDPTTIAQGSAVTLVGQQKFERDGKDYFFCAVEVTATRQRALVEVRNVSSSTVSSNCLTSQAQGGIWKLAGTAQ